VCLFAAHLASASGALGLDESKIRIFLDAGRTRVSLQVSNATGHDFNARLRVELLDPDDAVKSSSETVARVRRGTNSFEVPLDLRYAELPESDRDDFPWFRLRYSLAADDATPAPEAAAGVVSVSEVTPDLFELRVVSPRRARAGSPLTARVRTANPVTQRPAKGVAVEGALVFAGETRTVLKASGVTDGEGLVSLDFELPGAVDDDADAELKVTARRGAFAQEAETEVSVAQEPRVLLTTDKPLYQPGQTAHMRALVFAPGERAAAAEEVTFRVEDEADEAVFSETLKTSRFGVASVDWRVPEGARLGTYTLKLEFEDERYDGDYGAKAEFKVSRYDLPNFSVEAKPDRPFYLAGEQPTVEVGADYLFGQPVKRGRVRVVRQTERRWNYKEQKYELEEHPAVEGQADERGRFPARLDLAGEHKELADSDYERFRDLSFVAYVTDPTTNRTEQRRFSLRLSREPIHVYVNEGRFRQAKGLPLAFYLSTFYADGAPAECDVTVYGEEPPKAVFEPDGTRREIREPGRALFKARTNRYGVAKVSAPSVARDERRTNIPVRFVARDRRGRGGTHGEDFWLRTYQAEVPEIRVESDKTLYRAGEPIAVELTSDAQSMTVVVDAVSQGRVLASKTVRLSGGRAALAVPTGADFDGPVTVTATGVEPSGDDDDDYASGTRTVVFPRDRELKLDVRLSRKDFRPGEEAGAEFSLRTADGRRAPGALGVVVFDKAVEERARTDGEASRGFGFGGSLEEFWYGGAEVGGVTRRAVERLDLSRRLPEGFEAAAEMLYNAERPYAEREVATGTDFARDMRRVFSRLVGARLSKLKATLAAHYEMAADYPADEAALARMLAEGGVDFDALRDPWGQPFRPRFFFERDQQKLELYSAGADERPDTDDDFAVAQFSWPYFRKTGEALSRAASGYRERTGRFVRDRESLGEALRAAGLELDALRDRWGRPHRFAFGVSGTHYSVAIESAGADGVFGPGDAHAPDDFVVWVVRTDYFEATRRAVGAALDAGLRETGGFPTTRRALDAVLSKAALRLDEVRDGWGNPVRATFSTFESFDRAAWAEDRRRYDAAGGTHREPRPLILRTFHAVALRSNGSDGRADTSDDFTLGYYTEVGHPAEGGRAQAAPDDALKTFVPAAAFSGGSGAITGTVTDPQGASVPGVAVKARHNFASLEYGAETNAEGVYLLRGLPSGVYTLTFEAAGFTQTLIEQVGVSSSNLTKLDVAMSVAAVSETVTVTAESASVVNNTSSQMSSAKGREVVARAPLSTPRLREFFLETLVWSPELETARDGTARLKFRLADNITTWKMSVLASTEDGRLGTYEHEFLAFQPFFVEHDPPRVLTEGDEISLPVVLRNYLGRAQGVEVELKPESWFTLGGPGRLREEVPAGEAARPEFDFRAVASVTDGRQRVIAAGAEASDAVEKPVTVHPDGEERSLTDGVIFREAGSVGVNVPADAIRGSVRGELKLYPNLAAHVVEGVEAIMKRPYGCGEQTVSSTYPSVLVLGHYAKSGERGDEPAVVALARRYAVRGYERLLGYRAAGGGFSYWGGRGAEPDLALTAYALRFLNDARRVIEVDDGVLEETRAWLLKQQREDGSWSASRLYNGAVDKNRAALTTAFVARVLAATARDEGGAPPSTRASAPQTTQPRTPQPTPLQRALRYVAARVGESNEPYLVASFALAAVEAGDGEQAARAVARLRALAREEGGGTFWEPTAETPFHGWGLAGRIETTALAVQALNKFCGLAGADCGARDVESRALAFLLRKKDRHGVWHSTQASINVFDALLSSAAAANDGAAGMPDAAEVFVNGRRAGQLTLPASGRATAPLTLDLSGHLGAGDNRVEVRRAGAARQAQAQLVTTFYVPWSEPKAEADALRFSVGYDRAAAGVGDEVTCSVEAERVGGRGEGMLLGEVGLPPGADVDRASLERALAESGGAFTRYDVLPDRVVVYFWPHTGAARVRFKFRPRLRLNALTAPSQLYDYYNPEARSVVRPTRFVVR
jgi:hypothetical protein